MRLSSPTLVVATAYAISYTGAKCVLADIDPGTWCIDPIAIESNYTSNKAIMLVHTFGHPADMDRINKIAKDHIYLSSKTQLQHWVEIKVVLLALKVTFLFVSGAKLTVGDEGGIVCTNDDNLYQTSVDLFYGAY